MTPKVCDFGESIQMSSFRIGAKSYRGTPNYMAP